MLKFLLVFPLLVLLGAFVVLNRLTGRRVAFLRGAVRFGMVVAAVGVKAWADKGRYARS